MDLNSLLEWLRSPPASQLLLFALAALVGLLAGVINTLAGSGSLLTLPVLLLMGLSPHEANASNRIGVMMQSVTGVISYRRHGGDSLEQWPWFIPISAVGATLGAWLAAALGARQLSYAIAAVMAFLLFLLLFNPAQWLRSHSEANLRHRSPLTLLSCLLIGFYGGFLQAGAGVMILALMSLGLRKTLSQGNGYKLLMVPFFTAPSLAIFLYYDQVRFAPGLALGVGQMAGAWYGAKFAAISSAANRWIRTLLIIVCSAALLRLLVDLSGQ
ncbi:MAG: sulfite exporter TauE/SafE family protein [Leptospirales bacterium]|nr:sulfite exporter TauE/SafE family protein [Leptospirales bacterium]